MKTRLWKLVQAAAVALTAVIILMQWLTLVELRRQNQRLNYYVAFQEQIVRQLVARCLNEGPPPPPLEQ